MFDVFISYTREDQEVARLIADRIRIHGYSAWIDMDGITLGGSITQQIENAIKHADIIVILLSQHTKQNSWASNELQAFLTSGKVIIPVLLDKDATNNYLWPLLSDRLGLHIESGSLEPQMDRLMETIAHHFRQPPQSVSVDSPATLTRTDVAERVYIETSIVSYLTARPSNDLRLMANQNSTRDWWDNHRRLYECVISEFVTEEAAQGHPDAASRRMAAIADLPVLADTDAVFQLGLQLIKAHALPKKAQIDAYHVAIAAIHGIDYLLTWNCTHIANAHTRPKIEATCRAAGYEPPIICTPLELFEE